VRGEERKEKRFSMFIGHLSFFKRISCFDLTDGKWELKTGR
jgi:hypothetical protein